jgi:hypothetical protein
MDDTAGMQPGEGMGQLGGHPKSRAQSLLIKLSIILFRQRLPSDEGEQDPYPTAIPIHPDSDRQRQPQIRLWISMTTQEFHHMN